MTPKEVCNLPIGTRVRFTAYAEQGYGEPRDGYVSRKVIERVPLDKLPITGVYVGYRHRRTGDVTSGTNYHSFLGIGENEPAKLVNLTNVKLVLVYTHPQHKPYYVFPEDLELVQHKPYYVSPEDLELP